MPQLPLPLDPPRRQRFGNFVAGPNRALLDSLSHGLETAGWYLLAGPAGSGKSHLAAALLHDQARRTPALLFVPIRDLAAGHIGAMLQAPPPQMAILDDVDALAGRRAGEEALFHALNRWRQAETTVVMTATATTGWQLPDLQSRLDLATRLTLKPLPDADLDRLARQLAQDLGIDLSDEVVAYLLKRVPRNPRCLSECLQALWAVSRSERKSVTVPLVARTLGSL